MPTQTATNVGNNTVLPQEINQINRTSQWPISPQQVAPGGESPKQRTAIAANTSQVMSVPQVL